MHKPFNNITKALLGAAYAATAIPCGAFASDHVSLGVEGFVDHYQEPGADLHVDSHADYGSVTGTYTHTGYGWFGALDGRVSYGKDDYKSVSGTENGEPQWEAEARLRGGPNLRVGDNGNLKTYLGIGLRYYYDETSGTVTNLGYSGYDRHITQTYIPLGATYKYTYDSWTFSPTVEADYMFWGEVNSHLSADGGPDLSNTQHTGYGLRGEFMVGRQIGGYDWQIGPFIRYWNIRKSNIAYDPNTGIGGEEPPNERLQVGGALRLTF